MYIKKSTVFCDMAGKPFGKFSFATSQ